MAKFVHFDLKLPEPKWTSPLIANIMELSRLKDKRLMTANLDIFWELKNLFQDLENWASARIEGNQTELIDAVSAEVDTKTKSSVDYQELQNLKSTTVFIDDYLKDPKNKIDRNFILEIHKRVVDGLPVGENLPGDATPGRFRAREVIISKSEHKPPMAVKIDDYFRELQNFINEPNDTQNDFLKVAAAHHRFAWIHPFSNGNGRVARLLTYAMLQKQGYGVHKAHILNSSLVFYSDRNMYYKQLAIADKGTNAGLLDWSHYFIGGLLEEIKKIDRLLDDDYVDAKLIEPTLRTALDAKRISDQEFKILMHSLQSPHKTFSSKDINDALGEDIKQVQRSRILARMKKSLLIEPAFNAKQRYVIKLTSPLLIRYVVDILIDNGFIKLPVKPVAQ